MRGSSDVAGIGGGLGTLCNCPMTSAQMANHDSAVHSPRLLSDGATLVPFVFVRCRTALSWRTAGVARDSPAADDGEPVRPRREEARIGVGLPPDGDELPIRS
jgi:hypothetical protein